MLNFRIIARFFSLALIIEGLFMLLAAAVSLIYHEPPKIFFAGIITIVTGVLVYTPLRKEEKLYGNKEGYIIVAGIWLIITLFSTLPYLMTRTMTNFTDAFFESMSGFTTTGATVLNSIESQSHGILFWRSLTQWMGGLGFIIISLSLLPVVKSINIPLTLTDFTAQTTDKIHPKVREATKRLFTIYLILTLSQAFLLLIGGMNPFDAICHSFTTMSTGGFTTHDYSLASTGNTFILIVLTVFMFIAGTNMTLIYFSLHSGIRKIIRNNEFIFYVIICLVFILTGSFILWHESLYTAGKALLMGSFHIISTITTTGFYSANYNVWGNVMILLIFVLMFTGGTAGSAGGSLKMIRLLVATKNTRQELKRMIHPNAVIPVQIDHKVIQQSLVYNLLMFIVIYFIVICASSMIIAFMGYDIITSFSTSAALLGNIGPAIGSFGPFSTYDSAPQWGKWFFSFIMLLGRLELLSVLIFFTKGFYKR
ncbi:MAG: TrkH family potassium uptake protein [Bacteroidales bacterium]|nr:TrkH family potassium uptake protein [Bacteroidales bacterium]OQB58308.1 MAG: Trk system potassium uptake protein TrkH [Bacteroidetes bacterium ADurb.Bin145]